jgi:hypothetical protein
MTKKSKSFNLKSDFASGLVLALRSVLASLYGGDVRHH